MNILNIITRKHIFLLLKLALVASALIYLVSQGRLNFEKLSLFLGHPVAFISILLVFLLAILPLMGIRLWLILNAFQINTHPFRVIVLTWIASFAGLVFPGSITSDVVKGYYLHKSTRSKNVVNLASAIILDRVIGLTSLILIAFVATLFNFGLDCSNNVFHSLNTIVTMLFIGICFFWMFSLVSIADKYNFLIKLLHILPAKSFTFKIYDSVKIFESNKKVLIQALILALINHTLTAIIFLEVSNIVGISSVKVLSQFFIMAIGLITVAIPLAPAGIGVGHLAFDNLYRQVGVEGGADIFNLVVIIQIVVSMLGGIPFIFESIKTKKLKDAFVAP